MATDFIESTQGLVKVRKFLRKKTSYDWVNLGQKKALALFRRASQRVPAYKHFLKQEKINPQKIKTWEDFQNVPQINKKNYLRKFDFKDLHWDGKLLKPLVLTSTSGSTGIPTFFTRSPELDWQYASIIDYFLRSAGREPKPTLVIVGFAMGVWIGGLITYKAYEIASRLSENKISIITPGINKVEIIKSLKNLAPNYGQVILVGYPPFIKEVIDDAVREGINFHKLGLRTHFAAEAITETFRDYLHEVAGVNNVFTDTINIYGSADIGAMAFETGVSTVLKRIAMKKKVIFDSLFEGAGSKTPTLAQYNPLHIQFEQIDGDLVLTGDNSIPLVRYSIGDHGGVFSYDDADELLRTNKISFRKIIKKNSPNAPTSKLPFVYVFERADFSTTLYGINIYPETIREAFLQKEVRNVLTGKFTIVTKYSRSQDQFLEINIELNPHTRESKKLHSHCLRLVEKYLILRSSEFRELRYQMPHHKLLHLVFWPNGNNKYFKPGSKQKWVANA